VFGWVDKLLAAIYRRGRGLTEVSDRVAEEKRTAIRVVRDALRDAMTYAEQDREHGADDDRSKAMTAAQLASTTVHEVDDEEARRLVAEWRRLFDAIQKGWKEGGLKGFSTEERAPRGYPEPAWTELRRAADAAHDRLGVLLRDLMKG
jgi:hypothetical protein